jgi:glycosyltransferase involved in cell wall biosynthesis
MNVDIIAPVHNEAAALERNIPRLYDHLKRGFPFRWKVVVVDHGSTDGGFWVARKLEEHYPGVAALQVALEGRGRALKRASQGLGDVFCCIDAACLPADLDDISRLVRPVAEDRCDIVAGQCAGSGWGGGFIPTLYSLALRLALNLPVADAQCPFKVLNRRVALEIVPLVRDESWFFDTELLAIAQARGCRLEQAAVSAQRPEGAALGEPLPDWMRRILELRRRLRNAAPKAESRSVTR